MYHGDSRPQDLAADAAMTALYRQLDSQDLPDDPDFDTEAGLHDLTSRIGRRELARPADADQFEAEDRDVHGAQSRQASRPRPPGWHPRIPPSGPKNPESRRRPSGRPERDHGGPPKGGRARPREPLPLQIKSVQVGQKLLGQMAAVLIAVVSAVVLFVTTHSIEITTAGVVGVLTLSERLLLWEKDKTR